jgi:YesN/AraC family two-component response regulator
MSRILVIDDDLGTRETFQAILRLAGFDVATAANGEHGLDVARRANCDLVLADLRLPDMSGLDVLRSLRDEGLEVPFVIVTAFPSVDSAITALKLHADDYIEKPIDDTDLVKIALRMSRREPDDSRQQKGGAAIDSRVVETLRLIEVHYMKSDFGLRFVADRLNISTAYLCRLMKQYTGHTFSFYVHNARIGEARRL